MRCVVVGLGGIGGFFAACLARAGHEVVGVERWREHADAVLRDGLRVTGDESFAVRIDVRSAEALDDLPADLGIVAVKRSDTAEALAPLRHLSRTALWTSLQNGLGTDEAMRDAFGDRVVSTVTLVSSSVVAPGVIRAYSRGRPVFVSRFGDARPEAVDVLHGVYRQAGLDVRTVADAASVRWSKLIEWIPLVVVPTLARLSWGETYRHRQFAALFTTLEREVVAVARATGHTPADYPGIEVERRCALTEADAVEDVLEMGRRLLATGQGDYRSAMLLDLERGRRTEVDATIGAVVRAGRAAGCPVPCLELVWRLVDGLDAHGASAAPPAP